MTLTKAKLIKSIQTLNSTALERSQQDDSDFIKGVYYVLDDLAMLLEDGASVEDIKYNIETSYIEERSLEKIEEQADFDFVPDLKHLISDHKRYIVFLHSLIMQNAATDLDESLRLMALLTASYNLLGDMEGREIILDEYGDNLV